MKRKLTGYYTTVSTVGGENCKAFIPDPLPPKPEIKFDADLQTQTEKALLALGRLDSVSTLLPDTSLFLYMYVRKEAVLSSQIEGTQSSLSDLLKYESKTVPSVPLDDVQEVSNYVAAINHGLTQLKDNFPISLRLIKEIHEILLSHGRGSQKKPGAFRTSQNWIGGSRPGNAVYIPPPPDMVMESMGKLEKFLHDDPVKTSLLLKAALAHVQFESIHPFLDGNGRLGRLLITMLLCSEGALSQPLLYLSLYFKSHREDYYNLLQKVRLDGDWELWVSFFLQGIEETANQAVNTARQLVDLFKTDRKKIEGLGKASGSALQLHHVLQQSPILTISKAMEMTSISFPTASKSLKHLQELGIVSQVDKTKRAKVFSYTEYIRILNEGTEPL